MYIDISIQGNDDIGDRLAADQVADEELGAAAVAEWRSAFDQPYGMYQPPLEVPDGYQIVGAVGHQRLIAEVGPLDIDAVVWPFPMFAPDWADGFRLGTLFARFRVVLTEDARKSFVGEVPSE
jgi:hypothetical protein